MKKNAKAKLKLKRIILTIFLLILTSGGFANTVNRVTSPAFTNRGGSLNPGYIVGHTLSTFEKLLSVLGIQSMGNGLIHHLAEAESAVTAVEGEKLTARTVEAKSSIQTSIVLYDTETSIVRYDARFAARQMGLDPEHFAQLPQLRQEYVTNVVSLRYKVPEMRRAGISSEQIARALHAERRTLGIKYKALTPPDELELIYARNLKHYQDELGPTIEWFRERGKSWDEIIESASRPGGRDLGY